VRRRRRRHFCDAAAAGHNGPARRRCRQYVGGAPALPPITVNVAMKIASTCVLFVLY